MTVGSSKARRSRRRDDPERTLAALRRHCGDWIGVRPQYQRYLFGAVHGVRKALLDSGLQPAEKARVIKAAQMSALRLAPVHFWLHKVDLLLAVTTALIALGAGLLLPLAFLATKTRLS